MNRKLTIALLVAAASAAGHVYAGTSLAGDISVESAPFVSTATRAEVRAELQSFKKSGTNPWSMQYNPVAHFTGQRTRADVNAEYQAWRAPVAALTSEDSGSAYLAARQQYAPTATTVAGQSRHLK